MEKIVKDPLYGYIKIEDSEIKSVLDSASFHRLKSIIQTSYCSVYPSAVHNRFTHSLGVYHLGTIAGKTLIKSIQETPALKITDKETDRIRKTFLLACLLHDVGHSPFSHTGEKFYIEKEENGIPLIWVQLKEKLADSEFNDDSEKVGGVIGAEHEIMSSLLALTIFEDILENIDRSFFVRCIIGLKYTQQNGVKNCFIELLNSKTIDVDKLDYLLRDSFLTGFESVSIDYMRLLNSVCIINENDCYQLGYTKAALSTLENVILARDMEKKWIQNHPTILYESYLVNHLISQSVKYYKEKGIDLFSVDALTEKGLTNNDHSAAIRLLSDSDILFIAKNLVEQDSLIHEYFNRGNRKKPLWKSESEYRILFEQDAISTNALDDIEESIQTIEKLLNVDCTLPVINDDSLLSLKKELDDTDKIDQAFSNSKSRKMRLGKAISLIQLMKQFAENKGMPFEFVVISANQFNTGFNIADFKKIKIRFSSLNQTKELKDILQLFDADPSRSTYFMVYINSNNKNKADIYSFTKELFMHVMINYHT